MACRSGRAAGAVCLLVASCLTAAADLSPSAKQALYSRRSVDVDGVYNGNLAILVNGDGRYDFGAYPAGGAAAAGPNSFNLSFNWPSTPATSYTTVRIDGEDHMLGDADHQPTGPIQNAFETSQASYQIGPIAVRQELRIVSGPNSGIADTAAINVIVQNTDSVAHTVGVRVMLDTMLRGNDSAPFRVPGIGPITTEHDFLDSQVPDYWQAFNDLSNPSINAQGTLNGSIAFRPNRFVIANWNKLNTHPWDVVVDPSSPTGDSAVAVYWNEADLPPDGGVTYTTLYGLGQQTVVDGNGIRVGLTAPANVIRPDASQFDAIGVIENTAGKTLHNVVATLHLPPGLTVVAPSARRSRAPGSDAPISLGDLVAGASRQVSWRVDTQAAPSGSVPISLSGNSSDTATPSTVTRNIELAGGGTGSLAPVAALCTLTTDRALARSDGVDAIKATVTLLDASGNPVAGYPAGSIQLIATPAAGVTIRPGGGVSASDGTVTFQLTSTRLGNTALTATVDGTAIPGSVQLVFATGAVTLDYALHAGANLISFPFATTVTPTAQLQAQLQGVTLKTWNPVTAAYVPVVPFDTPGADMGRGVWAITSRDTTLTLTGIPGIDPNSIGGPDEPHFAFPLVGEWNLVANPLVTDLTWDLSGFEVLVDGEPKGTLADQSTWQYVDPYGVYYDGGSYQVAFDSSFPGFGDIPGIIEQQRGFWMRRTPGPEQILLVPDFDKLAGQGSTPVRAAKARAATAGSGWAAALKATVLGAPSASVTFGANPHLSRALEFQIPPAPGSRPVQVSLLSAGRALSGLVRAEAGAQTFDLQATAAAGSDVTLTWANLQRRLPAGLSAQLVDRTSGGRVAMGTRSSYTYRAAAVPRAFQVVIQRTAGGGHPQLTVAGVPTRGRAAGLTITLSAPATVTAEVRTISGRVIRRLSSSALPAGSSALSWDGRDSTGRPVPAGVYQLVATAEGADGLLTRAVSVMELR